MLAETRLSDLRRSRRIREPLELRIVARQERGAARLQPEKNFRLGVGDRFSDLKNSRCTGSMVVITATCGRTSFASGSISPAWFIPSSNTAKRALDGTAQATAARPSDC
jgi:hypothetical protein